MLFKNCKPALVGSRKTTTKFLNADEKISMLEAKLAALTAEVEAGYADMLSFSQARLFATA